MKYFLLLLFFCNIYIALCTPASCKENEINNLKEFFSSNNINIKSVEPEPEKILNYSNIELYFTCSYFSGKIISL